MLQKVKEWISSGIQLSAIDKSCSRFIEVFEKHGVEVSQIPRLVPELKLSDLSDKKSLQAAITPKIIDQVANLFRVKSRWLEGAEDQIYSPHYCYKSPKRFFELFESLKPDADYCPLRALTHSKHLDYKNPDYQPLVLVLVETVAPFGDDFLQRYHVFGDGWDWSYTPTRIQLKAIVRLIDKSVHPVPMFEVPLKTLESVRDGKMIPGGLISMPLLSDPSLEDYACSKSEHAHAKETDELPSVSKYIEIHQLSDLICNKDDYQRKLDTFWYNETDQPKRNMPENDRSRKGGHKKNEAGRTLKEEFMRQYQDKIQLKQISAAAAARAYFDALEESSAINLFRSKEDYQKLTADEARLNAVRTLTNYYRLNKRV